MNAAKLSPRSARAKAPSPEPTLRRLFLTLFLRGRSARGLSKESAPKSVGAKLASTLALYALVGFVALLFRKQPVFALSVYLHAMTFVFLGMFVAASAGEVLFNKEEGDILLHRPVSPRMLLWAKISVLVEVSLWLAAAFNLAGLFIGIGAVDGGWSFPVIHAVSTSLEALFCASFFVLVYQLCLRWFGRERLENLMTGAQVLVAMVAILAGQLAPPLIGGLSADKGASLRSWWIGFLPPAWFASIDDALGGRRAAGSWILGLFGLAATLVVVWLAFGKLARDYEKGWQSLNEGSSAGPRPRKRGRWLARLASAPPLRWWLHDSVSRAGFLLTAAYLVRDRDVKLRVYPGLAPILMIPLLALFDRRGGALAESGYNVAFAGSFLGLIPMLGMNLLQYSQQWQASDIFRAAPMTGPARICHGARCAVLCLLALPMLALFGFISVLIHANLSLMALLLPGLIMLPLYGLMPCLGGKGVPLSLPTEEAKSAGRGLTMVWVMLSSMALSALTAWSWSVGWFGRLVLAEILVATGLYIRVLVSLEATRWPSLE